VYDYIHSKNSQIVTAYSGRFQFFDDFVKQTELRLEGLTNVKQDYDLQVEEFKANMSLKQKVLSETVKTNTQIISALETKLKEFGSHLVR